MVAKRATHKGVAASAPLARYQPRFLQATRPLRSSIAPRRACTPCPQAMLRDTEIGQEQHALRLPLGFFIQGVDHPAPRLALAVVDLVEVQHRSLHHVAVGAALALDDAPIAMLLAVLQPSSGAQT